MTIFIILLSFFVVIFFSSKFPHQTFIVLISLYADPGGYLVFYTDNLLQGGIKTQEGLLYLSVVPFLFSGKTFNNVLSSSTALRKIFQFLIFFDLYYILVYGFITPELNNTADFALFIKKNRLFIFSPFLLVMIYAMLKDHLKFFVNLLIAMATIILSLYFITLIFNIPLVPVTTFERYADSGVNRLSMVSYGFFDILLSMSFLVYISKIKINNRKWLFYSGGLLFVAILITLTRRTYIFSLSSMVIIYIIHSQLRNIPLRYIIRSVALPLFLLIGAVLILFPSYLGYSADLFKDLFSLVTTGKDLKGDVDYRFAGTEGVAYLKSVFNTYPFFGTGYSFNWFDSTDDFHGGKYKAHDNPLLGSLAVFGFFGALLNIVFYGFIIYHIRRTFTAMRRVANAFPKQLPTFEHIFGILIISQFSSFFITQFFSINQDLFYFQVRIKFLLFLGLLMIVTDRFTMDFLKMNSQGIKKDDVSFQNQPVFSQKKLA